MLRDIPKPPGLCLTVRSKGGPVQIVKPLRITRQIYFGLVMMLGVFVYSPAQAQELDGAALEELALRGTWVAEYRAMGIWSWNEDKTVCYRIGDTEGECYDTGDLAPVSPDTQAVVV